MYASFELCLSAFNFSHFELLLPVVQQASMIHSKELKCAYIVYIWNCFFEEALVKEFMNVEKKSFMLDLFKSAIDLLLQLPKAHIELKKFKQILTEILKPEYETNYLLGYIQTYLGSHMDKAISQYV